MAVRSEQLQIRVTPRQKADIKRLARGAGQDVSAYVLSRVLNDDQVRFAGILAALRNDSERRLALAELHDFLVALAPVQFRDAVARAELGTLSPFVRNYVAAMVEHAAAQKQVVPPTWVRDVLPLDTPHFATSLEGLRLHLLKASPVAFKRRNLFVDTAVGGRA